MSLPGRKHAPQRQTRNEVVPKLGGHNEETKTNGRRKREGKPLSAKGQDPLTTWMKPRLHAWVPLDKAMCVGELILGTAR